MIQGQDQCYLLPKFMLTFFGLHPEFPLLSSVAHLIWSTNLDLSIYLEVEYFALLKTLSYV